MTKLRTAIIAGAAGALLAGGIATPALAERDPAYAAARAAGQVGERMDGYLGVVGAGSRQIQDMVDDINIKRKAVYSERARAEGATIEQYAFTAGCLAIARTVAGEKYQAPDDTWQTRTADAPLRDLRCP